MNTTEKTRIAQTFEALSAQSRSALVTYVTAGDPEPQQTLEIMHALTAGGADIIELGIPFSDPMADGPVIQRASERALAQGMSLRGVLEIARAFRATNADTPLVLMGYLNPIERMGYAAFAAAANEAGVDGVIVVDVPPEEARDLNGRLREHGLDQVFLIAPNSPAARIDGVCEFASGFVYYVSVKGVTGGKSADAGAVGERVREFRRQLSLPVGVGFGIKTPATAAEMASQCDAVIVGSALVEIIERLAETPAEIAPALTAFVRDLRSAVAGASAA